MVARVNARVVRRLGYDQTHVVEVGTRQIWTASFLGADFRCIGAPAQAVCGTNLRDKEGVLVLMKPGTPVRCRACRHITGMIEAPEDNVL